MRTIQDEAQRRGFTVMLLMHQEDAKLQQEQLVSLKRSQVDGIILVPAAGSNVAQVAPVAGQDARRRLRPSARFRSGLRHARQSRRGFSGDGTPSLAQTPAHCVGYRALQTASSRNCASKDIESRWRQQAGRSKPSSGRTPFSWNRTYGKRCAVSAPPRRPSSPTAIPRRLPYSPRCEDRDIPLREIAFIGIDDLEFAQLSQALVDHPCPARGTLRAPRLRAADAPHRRQR